MIAFLLACAGVLASLVLLAAGAALQAHAGGIPLGARGRLEAEERAHRLIVAGAVLAVIFMLFAVCVTP